MNNESTMKANDLISLDLGIIISSPVIFDYYKDKFSVAYKSYQGFSLFLFTCQYKSFFV